MVSGIGSVSDGTTEIQTRLIRLIAFPVEPRPFAVFTPQRICLIYGEEGKDLVNPEVGTAFTAVFDFKEFDNKKAHYVRITDEKSRREITRKISPITQVNAASAPASFLHGDADELVPLQQSEIMVASLQKAGVPAKLIVW